MERGSDAISTPVAIVRLAWGSRSIASTLRPCSASAAATLRVLVVLAVPPFWLKKAMMRVMEGPRTRFAPGSVTLYVRPAPQDTTPGDTGASVSRVPARAVCKEWAAPKSNGHSERSPQAEPRNLSFEATSGQPFLNPL